jgi:hypothetical protein
MMALFAALREAVSSPERTLATANYLTAKRLFNHLVGGGEKRRRNGEPERLGCF